MYQKLRMIYLHVNRNHIKTVIMITWHTRLGLYLDINTCQISKECCIHDKIIFYFPPLILAVKWLVGHRSQLFYLVKLMIKFLCGSSWSSCHLKSLNLRSSCWTESFGHGFRARQVGMFSGCSIQSLWATPACVSVSDRLEREASSGAWKTQTNLNKAVKYHSLKTNKQKNFKLGTTNRGLGTVPNTALFWTDIRVVVHGICWSHLPSFREFWAQ